MVKKGLAPIKAMDGLRGFDHWITTVITRKPYLEKTTCLIADLRKSMKEKIG